MTLAMTRKGNILIVILVLIGSFITTLNITHAAPIVDPIDGILTDLNNTTLTATLTRGEYISSIALEFTEEMTPSFDLVNGHVDVYQETVNDNDGTISQGNRYYRFWTLDLTLHGVVVAVKGQRLDPTYESFVVKHPNCTVLAVIDNANDELSPFIYTKLACHMTQLEIDNLPEDENVLAISPLYTMNLPVVMN